MTTLPLGAIPLVLPGMVPLPGTMPTPHDPAAEPFLALLTQLVEMPVEDAPAPDAPEAEQPVAEQPVAEQPVAEQPVAEQPVAEQPADEQPADELPADELPAVPVLAPLPVAVLPPVVVAPPQVDTPAPAHPDAPEAEQPAAAPASAPAPAATPAAAATPPPVLTNRLVRTEAPPSAAAPVARQVFPEVVRAAVAGVTPNRVVVRLEPEHLGEVRVVLRTDRSGALEVSLAGGPEARAAMREGAPELRRLLEASGNHDAKVLVRHLADTTTTAATATGPAATATAPTTPTTPTTTVRTDVPTTGGLPVDVGSQGTAPGGEDRRGRHQQDARPGATDGYPDRTVETTHPAARRTSGLDVMM